MIISDPLKFVFIHVHRTGGASFGTFLMNTIPQKVRQISQHDNAKTVGKDFFKQHEGYFIFGFVRNPWDRILSWYLLLNKHKGLNQHELKTNFETFLHQNLLPSQNTIFDNYLQLNQLDYFTDSMGKLHNSYFAKFENYQKEVNLLTTRFNMSNPKPIPHLNKTFRRDYRTYYTTAGIKLVQDYCQKDIDCLGYRF